jgi:hypothetical protein
MGGALRAAVKREGKEKGDEGGRRKEGGRR